MNTASYSSPHRLYPVYLTFLLDSFGLAIIYPLLAPLFLEPHFAFVFSKDPLLRTLLFGLTISAFPLAQLFGAPMIGELSDRIGRKRTFLLTISGMAGGYALTGTGILTGYLSCLLIGRLCSGFFAGNLTVCLAALADVSPDAASRTRNFGRLGFLGGLSFVLGILAGSSFSRPLFGAISHPSLPFWIITFLSILNFFLILIFYKGKPLPPKKEKFTLWLGMKHIVSAFSIKKLRRIYLIYFFFMLCWVTSMQFLSVFLLQIFHGSSQLIQWTFISIGFVWSFTNIFIAKRLSRTTNASQVLLSSLLGLSILLIFSWFEVPLWLFLILFVSSTFCSALSWTNALAFVSLKAGARMQGRILGINQSMGALAAIVGPPIAGILAGFDLHWVYLFTCLSAIVAFLLLLFREVKIKNN